MSGKDEKKVGSLKDLAQALKEVRKHQTTAQRALNKKLQREKVSLAQEAARLDRAKKRQARYSQAFKPAPETQPGSP
jgi:chromosome segregation ATPase